MTLWRFLSYGLRGAGWTGGGAAGGNGPPRVAGSMTGLGSGAITLAGRGYSTRIEFGQGGPVHDSNCDFCGACIDVCPTATLMEHPNKWGATQTERWVATTCTQCSVGCSISLGTKRGRGVIVRPDTTANPVSRDQLCIRGRFHYDAVKNTQRLQTPLIRRNGGQEAATLIPARAPSPAPLATACALHSAARSCPPT